MISLRPARESDRRLLLEWRNDPETRSASLSHEPISVADHDAWFSRVLIDPDIVVYVGQVGDEPVGTVRFDRDPPRNAAEVSINLSPAHRGQGLSLPLLQQGVDAIRAEAGPGVTLLARIRPENEVSLRLFGRVGFTSSGPDAQGVELYELRG